MLREQAAIAVESLKPTNTQEAALALRGLAAFSTIIKNSADVIRNHGLLNGYSNEGERELEVLTIENMVTSDFEEIEEQHREARTEICKPTDSAKTNNQKTLN